MRDDNFLVRHCVIVSSKWCQKFKCAQKYDQILQKVKCQSSDRLAEFKISFVRIYAQALHLNPAVCVLQVDIISVAMATESTLKRERILEAVLKILLENSFNLTVKIDSFTIH